MADLGTAISAMVVLLVTASVGFLAAKLGWLDDHVFSKLSKILLNITLPCMIVASVAELDQASGQSLIASSFLYGFALYFGLLVLSLACNVVLRVPKNERGEYVFMGTLTNLAFIGIPVGTALFGPQAAFIAAIFILATNLVLYSLGVVICTRLSGVEGKLDLHAMLSGPLVAAVIAVLIFVAGIQLPRPIADSLVFIGDVTAPLAMMMVGQIIAKSDLSAVLGEWRIYVVTLLRQLVVPFAIWLLLRGMVPDPLILGVFVVMFAMPVGTIVPMIAANYGLDDKLPAKGTVISTILSFATIPALVALMSSIA
ncbi:MAG: AEC family transporter [Eggerthellaceae bacterium]|nr:AEC family transporter [Eggerthellaceae bacterium]